MPKNCQQSRTQNETSINIWIERKTFLFFTSDLKAADYLVKGRFHQNFYAVLDA